jgi:hypothetical protein
MDQRSNKRQRTVLDGRIVFNNRFSLIDCTVRDLSDTGARIAFDHAITIPPEFEIEIPKKSLSLWARVMWSNGKEHGVMFVDAPRIKALSEAPVLPDRSRQPDGYAAEQPLSDAAKLQEILDEAQHRIVQLTGVPADKVRLKLEIDFMAAGLKKQ